jgi:hypothetical protein
MWMVWIPASGAYFPETWYPSAAAAWLVLLVTALASRRVLPVTRPARVGLMAFAGLVAFNYLSILWAGSPGDALSASNQLLLYLGVAWTFAILPWTPRSLALLLGAWSIGVAAFCAIDLARAAGTTSLAQYFADYRYATPLQYPNATAALAVMGMWPAVILSARRELSPWIRGPLLGVALFLVEFSFLPQSRGALVGLAVTLVLVLMFAPDRLAVLVRLIGLGIGLAVSLPSVLGVTTAVNRNLVVGPVLAHAAQMMLVSSLVAVSAGLCLSLLDDSLRERSAAHLPGWLARRSAKGRVSRRGLLAGGVVVVLALGAAGALAAPTFSRAVSNALHEGRTDTPTGSSRLLSAAPEERVDYARVALRLFADSPLVGIGSGNFGRRYDALRRFPEHSQYVHNLPLRVLSETGIIGLGLLALVVGWLLVGLRRAALQVGGLGRAGAVAALAVSAFFAVHASFDWIDEFPVLAAPALALPLAAIELRRRAVAGLPGPVSPTSPPPAGSGGRRMGGWRVAQAGLFGATAAALAVALIPPYLELRYTDSAVAIFTRHPDAAYRDLDRAASVNPLSANSLLAEGDLAIKRGDWARARSAFLRAQERVDLWFARLQLALLDAHAGSFAAAGSELARAAALDAEDPVITHARMLVSQHRRVDPTRFDQLLLGGAEAAIYSPEKIR